MTETLAMSESDRAGPRRHTSTLMFAGLLGALLVLATTLAIYGTGADGWQLASRFTARFAFLIFAFTYIAGPLVKLWRTPVTTTLMRNRRGLGLAFAMGFFVHGATFISYYHVLGTPIPSVEVIGGGVVFTLTALMALTSNDWAVRTMGVLPWRWLHGIGVHMLAVMAIITERGQASGHGAMAGKGLPLVYLFIPQILLALLLLGVALHIVVFARYLWRRVARPVTA